MRTSRLLGSFALFATSSMFAVLPACSGENKSGLMLAITTDMKAPKDVNAVSVTISTNDTIKHNVIGRVTPQGEILLPATLAIVQPDDPNATIRVRVMAFQERKARVLRDVRTSIPAGGRVALLRIPLNFVNDGSVSGDLGPNVLPAANPGTLPVSGPGTGTGGGNDGGAVSSDGGSSTNRDGGGTGTGTGTGAGAEAGAANGAGGSGAGTGAGGGNGVAGGDTFDPTVFVPNCPNPLDTWIDGECHDAYVDPNSLPEFDEKLVGAGDVPGVCFDTKTCFSQSIPLQGGGNTAERPSGGDATGGGGSTSTPNPTTVDAGASGGADGTPKGIRPQNVTFNVDACTAQIDGSVDPTKLNVAVVTPDTGECIRPGECYVPIDQGEGGWKLDGTTLKLPNFVCKLVKGKNLRLAYSVGCAPKHEENPVCAETVAHSDTPPVTTRDGGDVGPTGTATLVTSEEFPSSTTVTGTMLYLAGATRIAQIPLFGGPGTGIQGVPNPPGKLPWHFGTSPFGVVLTNGSSHAYAYGGEGLATDISFPDGAVVNDAAYIQSLGKYFFAVGPQGATSGIYSAQSNVAAKEAPQNYQLALPTVIGPIPNQSGFLVAGDNASVVACIPQGAGFACSPPRSFASTGAGRPDQVIERPNDPTTAYGLFGNTVLRVRQNLAMPIARGDVGPVIVDGREYRRSIAANEFCVFYSSGEGVAMVPELGDKTGAGRVLYTPPAGKHVLGVTLAPKMGQPDGTTDALYFTLFAPMNEGGGLYMMDLPPECGGPTTPATDGGFGSDDAGPAFPDASTPPKDAGIGPADASVQFDASAVCAMVGQNCMTMPCCAGQGVCSDVPVGDGGFLRQCK